MSSLRRYALALASTCPLAACGNPPPAAETGNRIGSLGAPAADLVAERAPPPAAPADNAAPPVAATGAEADYIGRWTGPEGLVLDVRARPGGGVTVVNRWTLDDRGTFDGSVTAEGLRFVRGGEAVTASPGDGDATGMKWLAGKKDCLIVKPGEGYCRD